MYQAVIIHSGGMDSSICLALAIRKFSTKQVLSLSFSYDQRHSNELDAAAKICSDWGIDHKVITTDVLRQVTDNALINPSKVFHSSMDSMVIGRNGLLVRLASIYAHYLGAHGVYTGVMGNAVYRDCTRHYMDLMQEIMRIDLADPIFEIHTPLMDMTKAETMQLADSMGVLDYLLEHTITCYEGVAKEGCGLCPACELRRQGLEQYRASLAPQGLS